MTIKKIITGGCSFSDVDTPECWIYRLQELLPDVEFRHTGMGSIGNDLIQKKLSLVLTEELEKYDPSELCVIPMWSGTERTSFWVDNPDFIEDVISQWKVRDLSWSLQFCNLYGKVDSNTQKIVKLPHRYPFEDATMYDSAGGWYHCNYLMPDSKLTDEFFKTCKDVLGYAIKSIENIIFLQNLCKLKGVKIFQTFYRSYVYEDIFTNRDNLNIKYLFNQWDHDTIISTTGIYEHLRPTLKDHQQWDRGGVFRHIFKMGHYTDETKQYFGSDNWHPNKLGSHKWVSEVLLPELIAKGNFNA